MMKKAEMQEQEFLEICSSYDYDLLTNKIEMTLKDYQRITYLVGSLGYSQYLQFLIGKYMDLAQADEEQEEREHEIYLEYPEYYEDEGILEEEEKWLEEFLNQLPDTGKNQYAQSLMDFENKLLDDNTEIHKTAAIDTTASDILSSTFSDSSYQKLQNLLSDCTSQELVWILKSAQLIKECIRDTK